MIRTERGRVVYDRKEHAFTLKDMVRIGKGLADVSTLSEQATGFNEILSEYFAEQTVSFSEWMDWLEIGIEFFGTVLLGPQFRIFGKAPAIRGFTLPESSAEELIHRFAIGKLRATATTIEES